jgi:hypothetical protein
MRFEFAPVRFTRLAPPDIGVTTHANDLRRH